MRVLLFPLLLLLTSASAQTVGTFDAAAGGFAVLHGQTDGSAVISSLTPGVTVAATVAPSVLKGIVRLGVSGALSVPVTDGVQPVSSAEARVEFNPSGAPNGLYISAGRALAYIGGVGDPDDLNCMGCSAAVSGWGTALAIGKRFTAGRGFVGAEVGVLGIGSDGVGRVALSYGRRLR